MSDEKAAVVESLASAAGKKHGGAEADVEVTTVEVESKSVVSLAPVPLYQHVLQLPAATKSTLGLVLGVGFGCSSLLSTVVSVNPTVFPTGQLTAVQLCFFTLSFAAVAMRAVVMVDAWEAPQDSFFHRQVAAVSEIALTLLLFFFCDRTTVLSRRNKAYSEDFFLLLVIVFVGCGLLTLRKVPANPTTAKPSPSPGTAAGDAVHQQPSQREEREGLVDPAREDEHRSEVVARTPSRKGLLINRHQTDEWKGWMQMLFLWYHYFKNVSIYNEIRVFIAAYVWMTGFGNFTYYYNRDDFSLHRFLGMMWRLNLFVIFVCGILRNEYMLYYICPLHTLFTLTVYVSLWVKHSSNGNTVFLFTKLGLCVVVCYLVWDAPFAQQLFREIFRLTGPLFAYHDPYKPDREVYHEWFFRSFLDHYVWLVGMLVAYAYPSIEAWLRRLDDASPGPARKRAIAIKWGISLVTAAVMLVHYKRVLVLPKYEYNALHPYTSAIPILGFLILRNISQRVRGYYIALFEWFGKITLETYIAQFHIWMATTGLNGSPHRLLQFIPGDYPLCDFLVGSALMFFVSHRVAKATDTSKLIFFPPKASNRVLFLNLLFLVILCLALVAVHAVWNAILFR